jgi:hypothetical protein
MEAPRLPSFFRNVKTQHRKFKFRSPYFRPEDREMAERKRRLEEEVAREKGEFTEPAPRQVNFSRRRGEIRRTRGNWATIRTVIILIILIYLSFKGIQWAETTDFSKVLKILENG